MERQVRRPIYGPGNARLLELRGIYKQFGGVLALGGVDFDVYPGEVHVLLGENGAGKSTLTKILTGDEQQDAGQLFFKGQPIAFNNPGDARRAGIGVIYQERSLIGHLTVAENIYLGHEPHKLPGLPIIDRGRIEADAQALLDRLNLPIDPRALICDLHPTEQQMVEIARSVHVAADLIIMDEPTATLSSREVATLFSVIRSLRAQGAAVVYITHRLEEVLQIGDRVTVLRDGRRVSTISLVGASLDDLVRMMVGRPLPDKFPRTHVELGPEILRVDRLTRDAVLTDISFSLRAGEILGVTGLIGAGGTALARALFGVDLIDSGAIAIHGQPVVLGTPYDAIAHGIGLLTENRQEQGLILDMSAQSNMTLAVLRDAWPGPLIDHDAEHELTNHYAARLGIPLESLTLKAQELSGGTQQKVILSRWLATHSRVLIFDEPTQGVDIGAKVEIYRLMDHLAQQGLGLIIVSSDLAEIVGMCDRVVVLRQGRVAALLPRAEMSEHTILSYAMRGESR